MSAPRMRGVFVSAASVKFYSLGLCGGGDGGIGSAE